MLATTIKINEIEFVELKDIIYNNSGISFSENKKYLLENRLSKRLQELNFSTFKEYIYHLKYHSTKRSEIEILINLVTINETYFLRERSQVDYLVGTVVPEYIAKGKRSLRIWSIPCSTGEEPYSMAILLNDARLFDKINIEIIATDINSHVVALAKEGVYRQNAFRGVPPDFYKNFDEKDNSFTIKPDLKRRIKFNVGNLVSPTISGIIGKVDVIFCRNVLIYFDVENKMKTVSMFNKVLNDDGYLFVGHSESLARITSDFTVKSFGTGAMYRKN